VIEGYEENPILMKIQELMKEDRMMVEKICVATEIKYDTFRNIFCRPTVSVNTIKALKYAGIISPEDEKTYHKWVVENDLVGVRTCKKKLG